MDEKPMMDPQTTVYVVKKKGREVGRIPATAKNAITYIDAFGECEVDYVTDEDYCRAYQMTHF